MKQNKQSLTAVIMFRVKHWLSMGLITLLISLSSACQMTTPITNTNNVVDYSQYYLSLKHLSNKEIIAEEKHLEILINTKYREDQVSNQGKLILIYSLPNTKLHSPYKAKRLLNEHLLAGDKISAENFAFTMLLRDQLNSQLRLLEKQQAARINFNNQADEHHRIIKELTQQLEQVNQQLILLKRIDQNINERG
ncbi:hypothetical protein [Colwellia psychrerythraea]|uniref:Lipoprotein n=1 Tax=Colwellia psychrerythraea TaxID=28229 RepID=A0A099KM35_COLPS|nr:hypothetical protein [Colwellia psychrerythraea]KGJ90668.1 hypothetical protein GAB14E_3474 [Colwellia psychrerythraea]